MKYLFSFVLLIFVLILKAQVTIIVEKIPAHTPISENIYIAGTMNGWNPGDNNYKLKFLQDSTFSITFTPSVGQLKCKFTRGSWQKVEGTSFGTFRPDRILNYNGTPITVRWVIDGWEDISVQSTASEQVSLLSDTFFMPELNRKRRIWLYLPKDYHTTNKDYKVLYMHDGQNLFDRFKSFAGEWRIDESLDSLFSAGDEGCIVVGIENGGALRINEFTPWVHPQYGGGDGDAYVRFIVNTLKPYIDANFRTKSDAENTGIMGSSLGGLISYYAGLKYPEIFGRVGVFSPSFWFSTSSKELAKTTQLPSSFHMYMIMGVQEGERFINDVREVSESLLNNTLNNSQLYLQIDDDGQHKEWYWSREFPKAYQWLFEKKTSSTKVNSFSKHPVQLYYQGGSLFINNVENKEVEILLFNINGQLLHKEIVYGSQLQLTQNLIPAIYFYKLNIGGNPHSGSLVIVE